ncbi:MAG TPA: DUF3515 family protein [Mycobacteriales bacterium]|nr:DUF3515 family protein [Mycobacteriales bacterium]
MRAVVGRRAAALVAVTVIVGVVAWVSRSPGRLTVDDPGATASTATACGRFDDALPHQLGALDRRGTNVDRVGVAAYGEPAVVVLCGAPLSGRFRPTDPLLAINDIPWFAEERPDIIVFSLPRSIINVEVRIPREYPAELLSLLTDAVRQAQPL